MHPAIALSYAAYLVVGAVLTVLGPLVPEITQHYHVGYSAIGNAMVLNSLAYLPAVLLGGFFCARYGTRRVTVVGFVLMSLGYFTIFRAQSWSLFLTGYCLGGGLGFGLVEAGLNALVMDTVSEKQGTALNFLHVYAAAGAVLGPFLARGLVAFTAQWQWVYLCLAVAFTLAAIVFAFYPLPHKQRTSAMSGPNWRAMSRVLLSPVMIALAMAMMFYVGAEIGLSNWMYSYVVADVGGGAVLGALLSSLFWCGLGLGRLASAYLSERMGYERFLYRGALWATLAFIPGLIWRIPWVVTVSFFFTGLLFAGTFPTILAAGSKVAPGQSGPVAGVLIFFAGLGTMIFPPAMGQLADMHGIWFAMALALGCAATLAFITGLLYWQVGVTSHQQQEALVSGR